MASRLRAPTGERTDRKTKTYSYVAPPHFSSDEAVVYSTLRRELVSIEWAEEAAPKLLALAGPGGPGIDPVVAVFLSCFREADSCADAIAAVRAATAAV